jgi:hypothetical protein
MPRRQSEILLPAQEAFVDGVLNGLSNQAAAEAAGRQNGSHMANVPKIQAEIAKARAMISDATTLRRVDTINGILDAIQMAKLISDPTAVIRGWVEIGKILGHYAPEVREVHVSMGQARIKSKLEGMSDEDLLRLSEEAVLVVDAETVGMDEPA